MRRVSGVVQHYAWGDRDAIPALLGAIPDGRPWAEWWLGTHHGGPATVDGGSTLESVAGELPYLLKVLAAAEPLSLQTHPDATRAAEGFARENAAGIAFDDPHRIYRDPHAKPELICALTPFEALCGFLPIAAARTSVAEVDVDAAASLLGGDSVEQFVRALYSSPELALRIVSLCRELDTPQARLVDDLAHRYPGDPSVAIALVMHHVVLEPGEALFLDAGNLHAYLRGVGVEVMGASDNVVRCGLTAKHVDVAELLRIVRFDSIDDPVVRPVETSPGSWWYPTAGTPFTLWRHDVADGSTGHVVATGRDLMVVTDGGVAPLATGTCIFLDDGESVDLCGPCTAFRVTAD